MKVGIALPEAGEQAIREKIIQVAKQAEEEGFDSLSMWERLISPIKPLLQKKDHVIFRMN